MARFSGELVHGQNWSRQRRITVTCNVFPIVDGTIGKIQIASLTRFVQWNSEMRYWELIKHYPSNKMGSPSVFEAMEKEYEQQYNLG